jgi:sugar phosphate isomerase/epimerase
VVLKLSVVTPTPEVQAAIPVALLAGDFSQRLDKAVQLGYDGVELMALRPGELDADDLRRQLSRRGLGVAAVASGAIALLERLTLLAAGLEASRRAEARLHELIAFAAALGAPLVTIGGFRGRLAVPTWADRAAARAYLLETLHRAAEKAAHAGVRLVLEPLNRYESDVVNTAAEGLALIGEVGHSHVGLLLDTFHMNIEESTYAAGIEPVMAAGRLWHIHLGDSNRLPPGQGHIDFGEIVAALRRTGYTGYLSAELFPRPDPDAAAAMTVRHMRSVLGSGSE